MTVEVLFRPDADLSERVIFPVTAAQANGIEDARFVDFEDDGKIFVATYTAYSGRRSVPSCSNHGLPIVPMTPLSGTAARNKGMALFPRKIDGRYAMIGRQDNENLYLIYSDDLYTWDGGRASFCSPSIPWEFVQIGNCGSPIELDDCWLLLTHGVGPVRKYSIGAVLLDKTIPQRCSPARASRWSVLSPQSAKATCPTSSTPAGHAPRRPDHPALRGVGHLLQFCDDQDCRVARGSCALTAPSI